MPARHGIATIAAAVAVVAGACGSSGPDPVPSSPAATSGPVLADLAERVVLGLCQLGGDVADGDRAAAEATFLDRSHDGLHTIAGALESVDRVAAGDILEAKQVVEQALSQGDLPTAEQVATLLSATRRGLAFLEVPVPPCSA